MKFTILIIAAMATVSMANPLSAPKDALSELKDAISANAAKIFSRDDCQPCHDFYNKCRGSYWCWLNPYGCDVSCRADTCRKNGDKCYHKCGYDSC